MLSLTTILTSQLNRVPDRELEPEVMLSREEVEAYDGLTEKYLDVLHAGFVETVVNSSPPEGKYLEVGCGTGWISIGIAKVTSSKVRIVAVDLSEAMLDVARNNAEREGVADRIEFRLGDAKALPFGNGEFDAVYCHNMLHHIPSPEEMIREMGRVVRPSGSVCIRDLVRQRSWVIPVHVNVFGLTYDALMKREYDASIRAALSKREWRALCEGSGIEGLRVTSCWPTHQGMERAASRTPTERVPVSTSNPLKRQVKKLFVTV